ncbi:excinuclease ABC subunit A [Filimonas lacunae]|uniref:UvrABC system protein A n=1 Tax=Filimonas lacunae TaxID=477680 RepID=A0A173MRT1_9BACT|nr:excinuclease ABC subunit UvrA [Filimonas lacunae]BAV10363.1 excinuclease ABC subunit A paralog in greater Bacteroides group [Filimonas lacunae]SIT16646.1 excinuclease ABC subunit A [Filimonas lacunae]
MKRNTTVAEKDKKRKDTPTPEEQKDMIVVKGARTHNLKNVTVGFPRNKFIVVTGVSGSGKSSLTIDTLFAEGQRRYAESLSAYARQFMARMVKPDVDYIKGLCPAIAIEQKVITRTPRSTVGSMTEIYDYLRLLYARAGKTISPISGKEVKKDDVTDVVEDIKQLPEGMRVVILVAFKQHDNRDVKEELNILMQKGFSRMYIRGREEAPELLRIEELLEMDEKELKKKIPAKPKAAAKSKTAKAKTEEDENATDKKAGSHIYLLIDRVVTKEFEEDDIHRLSDSINTAFYEGEGEVLLEINGKELVHYSNRFELDGLTFEEPVPNLFSFNNPYGACPTCEGFGQVLGIDEDLVIPDRRLSVYEGAVAPWKGEKLGLWRDQFVKGARSIDFPIHKAIADLTPAQYKLLWNGNGSVYGIRDFFKEVEQNLYKVQYRVLLSRYRGRTTCPECGGSRLRKEALYIKIDDRNIGELCEWQVKDLQQWFANVPLTEHQQQIAKRILLEINQRLQTLVDVGLGYLTLNRLANSLSGGESQRIQLTRSLGSNLTNSLYILDEPSIGLHSRDTERLISVLKQLKELGNTVVVVEHDEMMMREADHIIDMGPLASHLGGEVVAAGTYDELIADDNSLTGKYLKGELTIDVPRQPRKWKSSIVVEGARQNNLKDVTVTFPLNVLCVVSGVSGSGKTTLVKQVLYPALKKLKGEPADKVGFHKAIKGDLDSISQIELVDQNPIGKSSRSNPITYIKAYDDIRDLYSRQPLAKMRGFQPKHFSFNVDGGRCDTCKGEGEQIVEMQFLADVHLTCEVCGGKRFKEEVLEVHYKGKSIYDVLEMSVDEAIEFFGEEKNLVKAIQPLHDVGLGYIKLGQSSDTLSGGEAQRVKLASFLGKGKSQGHIMFIFDEPTTGLHFHDIKKLLSSFRALIEQGHSLLVIEHNTDVIKSADWVIDLGPEAGDAGGNLVFAGIPSELKNIKESYTGKFL